MTTPAPPTCPLCGRQMRLSAEDEALREWSCSCLRDATAARGGDPNVVPLLRVWEQLRPEAPA